jgi:hypothetical protein
MGHPVRKRSGKTQWHGCIRLTNRDALDRAKRVRRGVPVAFPKPSPVISRLCNDHIEHSSTPSGATAGGWSSSIPSRSKRNSFIASSAASRMDTEAKSSSPFTSQIRPPTGEPDTGNPHVRFGGRGIETNRRSSTAAHAERVVRMCCTSFRRRPICQNSWTPAAKSFIRGHEPGQEPRERKSHA